MDLRQYRYTSDFTWYNQEIERIGWVRMMEIYNAIYKLLDKMKVGQTFSIERHVKPENYQIVIKAICEYIIIGNGNYEFNDTYTIVRKNESRIYQSSKGSK